jgi:hypothetical protein
LALGWSDEELEFESPGVKWQWCEADHSPGQEYLNLYIHSPIRLYGVVLNLLSTGIIHIGMYKKINDRNVDVSGDYDNKYNNANGDVGDYNKVMVIMAVVITIRLL